MALTVGALSHHVYGVVIHLFDGYRGHVEKNQPITAREFERAADAVRQVAEFLNRCATDITFPMLIGFDLDFLADTFDEAAERAKRRVRA